MLRPPTRYPAYCCGLIEAENRKNGYLIPSRVLIGDGVKARQVLLNGGDRCLAIEFLEITEKVLPNLISASTPSEPGCTDVAGSNEGLEVLS